MSKISEAVDRHAERFLALPGVSAISVGKKSVGGKATDKDAIVLHVDRKQDQGDPARTIPADLDGHPTDVVEQTFDFRTTATDPFERHDPVIGGLSITAFLDPDKYGSIGCFIRADGTVNGVPAGDYLLTNHHVAASATEPSLDQTMIQPGEVDDPTDKDTVGMCVASARGPQFDCAIVALTNRGFVNAVPDRPLHPGNRTLRGIGTAQLNDRVYKFGATTRFTTGVVTNLNFAYRGVGVDVQNAIVVQGTNGAVWCNGGDSGSVLVRAADDFVVGLNFRADNNTGTPQKGFTTGLAYDITTQVQQFSHAVNLA
ncbi:trypsin-like peptidase domain-containing protein [Umezawaea sp. NPDC059074]|uniref:trypsin-like peptidase domain-containing protein n=1 Tax=Umezawaea sp. NPDC059074 TaxID=3346716 RepID=UPI0036D00244